jgi:hypothetical protein
MLAWIQFYVNGRNAPVLLGKVYGDVEVESAGRGLVVWGKTQNEVLWTLRHLGRSMLRPLKTRLLSRWEAE